MSDPGRLAELLSAAKIENELDKKHWEGVRDQYRALDSLLERLPDKRVHQAMVPLSKIAFCPGRLVHTNEVMVLLGDKYFAKTSVKTAREIVESRTKQIEQRLEKNEIAGTQITERDEKLNGEFNDEDLIKEEWDEEKDKCIDQQRRAHRPDEDTIEKLRKEQSEKLKRINSKSEEELKSRLEVPEKIELRENEPEGKNVKFNSTLEDVCTIEEINKSDNESDPEEPLKCTFKWSKMSEKKYSNDKNTYLTPWDIDNNYKLRCADKKQSILKKTNKPVQKVQLPPKKTVNEPLDVSVGNVLERGSSGFLPTLPQKAPSKRVSLFKQKRMAKSN